MKLLPALRQAAILLGRSLLLISFVARVVAADQPAPIRFNDHIRPILAENCLACHGPDTASREADLRLDTGEGAIASGLIVPGQADESELIARIISDDPDEQMPPPDSGKKLSAQQKQLLVRWIDDGAAWEKHWSFIPPRRPTLPPVTGAKSWARTPIDHFVLAKLQQLGLTPNDGSDRHSLARRVALDIIGLPPNDEQLNAYLNDARDDAFSSYVDRLLQSRHAGEHRARYWLDAARYGDTHGMHFDNYREIWPYRVLGCSVVQPEQALRPIRFSADRRRLDAHTDTRAADRHRVQSLQHYDVRRRFDYRRAGRTLHGRPCGNDGHGISRADRRLRRVSRSQVRPDYAA